MKKQFCIIFSFLFFGINIYSQEIKTVNAFDSIEIYVDSLNYYQALKKLTENRDLYLLDRNSKNTYYNALATVYSFNQKPDSAIACMDRRLTDGILRNGKKNIDTVNLEGCVIKNAIEYILEVSAKKQVLMFNEAHHISEHRIFIKTLLSGLYENGYRYLALEALDERQSLLWRQDASEEYWDLLPQVDVYWGYYIKEPCYAEMLREALKLGFQLWAYEPADVNNSCNRDSLMADNINYILKRDPTAKIVVLGGYGHTAKSEDNLYAYFKKLSGITPFSINQSRYYERATEFYESAYYVAVQEKFNPVFPIVLTDTMGKFGTEYDAYVFHPRTKYVNDRPIWLLENGKRKPILVPNVKKPTVLKAYHITELGRGTNRNSGFRVPVDLVNVEFPAKKESYYLFLPEGVFLIQYQDLKGNVYKEYFQQVKL